MSSKSDHTFTVTVHAIYALGRFREYKLVDPVFTHFTLEAMRVIGVVARHDSLVKYGQMADATTVGTICAYWGTVRKEEKVSVCSDLISTLGTFETIDVEKGLPAVRKVSVQNS
jgi:hypothetical protein